MAAVGDGKLTLGEYDERSGALWQARTRAELDALVADLPGEAAPARPLVRGDTAPGRVVAAGGRGATGAPARHATSVAVPRTAEPERRGGRVRRVLGRATGLLVPAAVLGAVLLAGPDAASVFGSTVERVSGDNADVAVSTLFGSVTVVVPDGSDVDTSGLVVFGSTEADVACSADCTGGVIHVRALGAFGSVDVMTESQYRERQAADDREDVRTNWRTGATTDARSSTSPRT